MPRMIDGRGPYPDDYIPWEPRAMRSRPVPIGWLNEPMRLLDHLDEEFQDPVEWREAA